MLLTDQQIKPGHLTISFHTSMVAVTVLCQALKPDCMSVRMLWSARNCFSSQFIWASNIFCIFARKYNSKVSVLISSHSMCLKRSYSLTTPQPTQILDHKDDLCAVTYSITTAYKTTQLADCFMSCSSSVFLWIKLCILHKWLLFSWFLVFSFFGSLVWQLI